jgi:hypothetical protein
MDVVVVVLAFVVAAVVIVGLYVRHRERISDSLQLPPGPPGHWFFGNYIPTELCVSTQLCMTQGR